MIECAIARRQRVLLIRFQEPLTRETLARLDDLRRSVFKSEGAMDFIVDYSSSPPTEFATQLMKDRVAMPSPAPGHRRIYVAGNDLLFGAFRMYQIPHDDPLVEVVRTMGKALEMLGVTETDFEALPTQ